MRQTLPLFVWLILSLTPFSFSQPREFGDISMDELISTYLPQDTSANAYVIFDVAHMYISPQFEFEMERHMRIKILTEEGKSWADVTIPFFHEDRVINIEAASYSPDGESHELDEDNIFEEGSKNWRKKVFAIPAVEVGSVIEFRYKLLSKYFGALEPWFFHHPIYTKYSEINFYNPKYFTFTASSNVSSLEKSEAKVINKFNAQDTKHIRYTWVMKELSGIPKEPFMFNQKDYYAALYFQIQSYKSPYSYYQFAKSWQDVAKPILKTLKDKLNDDDTRETVEQVTAGLNRPLDKARALYDFVRRDIFTGKNVHWNSSRLLSPMEVIEKKEASRSEKNILLINLLRRAGFTADPFLVSSRSHGRLSPGWVTNQQFNNLIVSATVNGETYYLDTGNKANPFGSVPYSLYTGNGFLLSKGGKLAARFTKYRPRHQKNNAVIESRGRFNADGDLQVTADISYAGQLAFQMRNRLQKAKSQTQFIRDHLIDAYDQATIDTFSIDHIEELDQPLTISLTFSIPEYVETSGSLSFVEPVFLSGMHKNPFLSEKRTFPVDFYFREKIRETFTLHLPPGTRVSELPERSSARLKGFLYSRSFSEQEDNTLECRRSLLRKNTHFGTDSYPKLRSAYNTMLESDHTQVVLEQTQ